MFKGENTTLWRVPFIRRAVSATLVSGLCLLDFADCLAANEIWKQLPPARLLPETARSGWLLLVAVDWWHQGQRDSSHDGEANQE